MPLIARVCAGARLHVWRDDAAVALGPAPRAFVLVVEGEHRAEVAVVVDADDTVDGIVEKIVAALSGYALPR